MQPKGDPREAIHSLTHLAGLQPVDLTVEGPPNLEILSYLAICLNAEARPAVAVPQLIDQLGFKRATNLLLRYSSLTSPALFHYFRSTPELASLCSLELYLQVVNNHEELVLLSNRRNARPEKDLTESVPTISRDEYLAYLKKRAKLEKSCPNRKASHSYSSRLVLLRQRWRAWPSTITAQLLQLHSEEVLQSFTFGELHKLEQQCSGSICFADIPPARAPPATLLPRALFYRPWYTAELLPKGVKPPYRRDWLRTRVSDTREIPPTWQSAIGTSSVVSQEIFVRQFHEFTSNVFKGFKHWQNMMVTGGAVVASLLPATPTPSSLAASASRDSQLFNLYHRSREWAGSDVDVYTWGLSDEQFRAKLTCLYKHFRRIDPLMFVVRTEWTLTFVLPWPKRKIQLVLGSWRTRAEVLFEPDIDCTCVGFDGTRVWTTDRARLSFNFRSLFPSNRAYFEREFPEYEERLYKYSRRGFYIVDPAFAEPLSNFYSRHAVLRFTRDTLINARLPARGLRLLCHAFQHPHIESNHLLFSTALPHYSSVSAGILYGPNITLIAQKKAIEANRRIESQNYGPSFKPSPYTLLDDPKQLASVQRRSLYAEEEEAEERPSWKRQMAIGGLYRFLLTEEEITEFGSVASTVGHFDIRSSYGRESEPPNDKPLMSFEFSMPPNPRLTQKQQGFNTSPRYAFHYVRPW